MARQQRPYMPGAVFHLTTRLQNGVHHLDDHSMAVIQQLTASALDRVDIQLLGYVWMTNHLHFVVRQGSAPLSAFMQPLLRRIALHVQRRRSVTNHVFGNTFFHKICMNPEYLRTVLVYAHLNPCRASVCETPDAYPWSSHAIYSGVSGEEKTPLGARISSAVEIFRSRFTHSDVPAWSDYARYVDYRLRCDAATRNGQVVDGFAPDTSAGDLFWSDRFAIPHGMTFKSAVAPRADLRDTVKKMSIRLIPDLPVDVLRTPHCTHDVKRARDQIIRELVMAGHSGVAISTFFDISTSRVSQIGGAGRAAECNMGTPRLGVPMEETVIAK